jgi:hypothetical protein
MAFQLPMQDSSSFPALFNALDKQKEQLGVVNYGMSMTTMESVFLKVITEDSGPVTQFLSQVAFHAFTTKLKYYSRTESAQCSL